MKNNISNKKLNSKKVPKCDYHGTCKNKAFKEVYSPGKKMTWSYLCRKHFEQEKKKFKGKLGYCSIDW